MTTTDAVTDETPTVLTVRETVQVRQAFGRMRYMGGQRMHALSGFHTDGPLTVAQLLADLEAVNGVLEGVAREQERLRAVETQAVEDRRALARVGALLRGEG